MSQALDQGQCEHCQRRFSYDLVHHGFNNSAFAYCNSCNNAAVLDAWFGHIPEKAGFRPHGPIPVESEPWLLPCRCGGSFKADATPRCPHCNETLSPDAAKSWIEENAPGTSKGWRWQNSWSGVYSIVIEHQSIRDNWRKHLG